MVSKIVIFDDSSPILPDWDDVHIVDSLDSLVPDRQTAIVSFPNRLGRKDLFDFEGWYRSFSSGVCWGIRNGYKKIVHIESDAYLISDRAHEVINGFVDGWMTVWCPKYEFPEMAIQVISGSARQTAYDLFNADYEWLRGMCHERLLPFTHVDRSLIGDRDEQEGQGILEDFDWVTQVSPQFKSNYFWWLRSNNLTRISLIANQPHPSLVSGWSLPEHGFVWSEGVESRISLSTPDTAGKYALYLDITPAITGAQSLYRRVDISIEDRSIAQICLFQRSSFIFYLPNIDRVSSKVEFLFRYDATLRPIDMHSESEDERNIAIRLYQADILLLE